MPRYHANVSATRPPVLPGRAVRCITLVLALEAQLPTGCQSRSTSPGRTSFSGARGAGRQWHSRRRGRARTTSVPSDVPVEAAGAVDAQTASTAPWKTLRTRFPQLPQASFIVMSLSKLSIQEMVQGRSKSFSFSPLLLSIFSTSEHPGLRAEPLTTPTDTKLPKHEHF